MRAITVKQPWARAIASGAKTVENRGRPHPWAQAVGQRIAIHAGLGWDSSVVHDPRLITAAKDDGDLFAVEELDPACYEYGVILATAALAGVHEADSRTCRCSWNPWAESGCWHLVLLDVRRLRQPVAVRGALGLWPLPADVLAAVHERAAGPA